MATNELRVIAGGASHASEDLRRTNDPDAEQATLGSILVDPSMLEEIAALVSPEHFYSEANRRIFETFLELRAKEAPIDPVAVMTSLRAKGRLEQVGRTYPTELVAATPVLTLASVVRNAKIVRDLSVRRELDALGQRVSGRCRHDAASVEELLEETRDGVEDLVAVVSLTEKRSEAAPVVERMWTALTAATSNEGPGGTCPTGFARLDELTAGLHEELVLVGARPGMGKTALVSAIARNVGAAGLGVFVASLETKDVELMQRLVCMHAGVDMHRCRTGALSAGEWARLTEAASYVATLPIWVDDTGGMSVADLWGKCRRAQLRMRREGRRLAVVVVDYVQLLRAPRAGMRREEVVAENARALKALSTDLRVTVLGCAQLNREIEKRADKRPTLGDLRESGELEQCARTIVLLYREDYYRRREIQRGTAKASGLAEVNVAKQNNGPTGMVRLRFDERCLRFSDLDSPDEEHAQADDRRTPTGHAPPSSERPRGGLDT